MIKSKKGFPSVIHSERGDGFHNFFKDECKKIEYNVNRVQITTSPFLTNKAYLDNYDLIQWKSMNKKHTKNL